MTKHVQAELTAKALAHYYAQVRQAGHTTAAASGLPPEALYLVHNQSFARMLKEKGVNAIALDCSMLRGRRQPLVVDHCVLEELCWALLAKADQLEKAEQEIEELKKERDRLKADLHFHFPGKPV